MTIAVLGAGMVGSAIARDLAQNHRVTAFDLDAEHLGKLNEKEERIKTVAVDLGRTEDYPNWLSPFDLVVTAVPGFMGYKTLEAVIRAGKNVVDISFFPEDALALDHLAKEMDVTVITDCGVAPGMSNLVLGRYNKEMKVDRFACYVGGLPRHPQPPFHYKAPFSPIDVIQEYIRPARMMEQGEVVTLPALSGLETLHFDKPGDLEAFNTDGLRSLLFTMSHIPDMKEKTLRYPGHAALILALKQAGFFNDHPIRMGETDITPLDFTSRLLIDQWKLGEEEEEFTVMRILVEGEGKTIRYDLYDEYDPVTGISSMARTTGYTCTAAVNLLTQKLFEEKGVFPPEYVGRDKSCFEFILSYLAERNVTWKKTES